jgi:hypothetical protein
VPDLNFSIEKAEPVTFAAAPLLHFALRVHETENQNIHAVALRCQIRIEPARRRYDAAEKERLLDLFGQPARWGQTLKSMLWAHTSIILPPFSGSTTVNLPVPCSTDFNLAAAKYFHALENDEVPLTFLFSGTIFYQGPEQMLQVAQISWEREASFRLPVSVWKQMMDHYYPNSAWLCLHKDAFDRLNQFKSRNSLTSWEAAIEKLLNTADEQVPT